MDSNSISAFNARLLELEQKFDAFRSLQEDELSEIKSILVQLRQDLLILTRDDATVPPSISHNDSDPSITDGNESLDDLPILAL